MKRKSLRWSIVLPALLLTAGWWQTCAEEPVDEEISRLVKQLGSDRFAEREAASKRLGAIGEPALEALRKAAASNDAEVRRRARVLVRAIEPGELLSLNTGMIVEGLAVTRAGDRLLCGHRDGNLSLWDLAKGTELRRLGEPRVRDGVVTVAFSPDDRRALAGFENGRLELYDVASGKLIRSFAHPDKRGHAQYIRAVVFTPNGKQALSACQAETVFRLWDVESGKELRVFEGHRDCVFSIACTPDGKRVATGSNDSTVRLWDLESGKELRKLAGHRGAVLGVAISPDGKTLVSGSLDGTVRPWDTRSGKQLRTLAGHKGNVCCVAFGPDGKWIASGGGGDGRILLWNAATGKLRHTFDGHRGGPNKPEVSAIAFVPDGRRLVSGGYDFTVRVWRLPRARGAGQEPHPARPGGGTPGGI